jgi:hypothetical protein
MVHENFQIYGEVGKMGVVVQEYDFTIIHEDRLQNLDVNGLSCN